MTLSFKVVCTTSEKIGSRRASLVLLYPTPIFIKIQDIGYAAITDDNRLMYYLSAYKLFRRNQQMH